MCRLTDPCAIPEFLEAIHNPLDFRECYIFSPARQLPNMPLDLVEFRHCLPAEGGGTAH